MQGLTFFDGFKICLFCAKVKSIKVKSANDAADENEDFVEQEEDLDKLFLDPEVRKTCFSCKKVLPTAGGLVRHVTLSQAGCRKKYTDQQIDFLKRKSADREERPIPKIQVVVVLSVYFSRPANPTPTDPSIDVQGRNVQGGS